MPTIDRKPPELPSLIAVAAALAREGRGAEAQAVKNAADLLARSACDGDGERDAARYRYVRETCYITFGGYGVKGDALDEAVDAAIAAKGAGE
jgi:hypothetical protein